MLIFIFGFLFGTILGSFILCIASRTNSNETFWGRSYCDHCHKNLSALDLIPVFSYLVSRGKCRHCHHRLSAWYPISEIIVGLLVGLVFWQIIPAGFDIYGGISSWLILFQLLFELFVISVLSIVLITDIKTGLIPDRITYPAFFISLMYLVLFSILKVYLLFHGLSSSPFGKYLLPPHSDYFYRHALIIFEPVTYGLLAAVVLGVFFGMLILITRGRGMGGGDLKLAILIGLILNIPFSIIAIMLSFLLGSVFGILLIIFGKKKFGQTIPFGPFMSLGALITLLWGNQILNWYLSLNFI